MIDLSGKKFLVTGASSRVGRATAVMISRLGGCVVLNGRDTGRLHIYLSAGNDGSPVDVFSF